MLQVDLRRHKKLMLGLYEIEISRYLRRFAQPGCNSFDVGGQSGYYALVLSRLTGGHVISFDSDPSSCAEMNDVFARNGDIGARAEVLEGRVGDDVSLDEVAYSRFVPDVVKMDNEGAEYDALRGAKRLLRDRRPHLIVETHGENVDRNCRRLLEENGYSPIAVEPRKWLPDYRPADFNRWLVAAGR